MTSDATKLLERPYIDMVKNQVPERTDGCLSMAGERALVDLIEAQQRKIETLRSGLDDVLGLCALVASRSDMPAEAAAALKSHWRLTNAKTALSSTEVK